MLREWFDRNPVKERPLMLSVEFYAGALTSFALIGMIVGIVEMMLG
jgi:hypothetical protein